jgi:hypothetical protein
MLLTRRTFFVTVLISLICGCTPSLAQHDAATVRRETTVFSLDQDREPVALLNGLWRFQPGDDPTGEKGWARADFDDSKWAQIRSDKSWSDQGYKDIAGTAWYRVKVLIPEGQQQLSIDLPYIYTNYQIFADGQLIGGRGAMPPDSRPASAPAFTFALPADLSAGPRTLTIALRVWHWKHWASLFGGGLQGGVRIGRTELIQERAELRNYADAWRFTPRIFLAMLEVLGALTAWALFGMRSKEKEYLWFGVWLMLSAANRCLSVYMTFHLFGEKTFEAVAPLMQLGGTLASISFYFHLLRGRRNWLFWLATASIGVLCLVVPARPTELISIAAWNSLSTLLLVPTMVWILTLLIQRAIEGIPDARLLLAPGLLQQLVNLTGAALWILYVTRLYPVRPAWFYRTSQWPFPVSVTNLADGLFMIAMIAILIYRFARRSQHEERLAGELEAARTVQQILVPEDIPVIPGFTIQTVYKPFGQVGGDFFQILPLEAGGVLVAIGDVSGKGMPAAMTVSLIVGALRMAVETTSDPAGILAALNRRLYGRNYGGFTTCAILRADADGRLTIANAGHLSPYLYGAELLLEGGLPLGLMPDCEYTESTFHLGDHEQVTLVTDGVVEARSKSGELFGFDRTAAIATRAANSIAQTAQHFGQDDDITVLTLTRP